MLLHGSRVRTAFTTDDNPRYPIQVKVPDRADEGFNRKETNCSRCRLKMSNSPGGKSIFDGHTEPHMSWCNFLRVSAYEIVPHHGTSLCEHLEDVPVGSLHYVEYLIDECRRDLFVKEIAHGVDKHFPGGVSMKVVALAVPDEAEDQTRTHRGVQVFRENVLPGARRSNCHIPRDTLVQPVTGFQVASVHSISDL